MADFFGIDVILDTDVRESVGDHNLTRLHIATIVDFGIAESDCRVFHGGWFGVFGCGVVGGVGFLDFGGGVGLSVLGCWGGGGCDDVRFGSFGFCFE